MGTRAQANTDLCERKRDRPRLSKVVTTPARPCNRRPAVARVPGTTAGEDGGPEPGSRRIDPRTLRARPYHPATQPAHASHNLCRLGA